MSSKKSKKNSSRKISVIGLGYVGLPVAVAFGTKSRVIGFDINQTRLNALRKKHDFNNEVSPTELKNADILFTSNPRDLKKANFHIVTVPTPIDDFKRPDLKPLVKATETIAGILKKGDVVVYESTVYPGLTEEECLPILEKISGLKGGRDFKVGYSPERINPGDKEKRFTAITKVVSGMDSQALNIIAETYGSVVKAGVHRVSSIKVAEAAKIIENTQRDLNIALMNELAIIFHKLGIDTEEVLKAAGTKWNFLKFTPGLVGGHCIGVDPFYLTHKADQVGYHPHVILAGRRINDTMGNYVADHVIKELVRSHADLRQSVVTVFGLTFKENCPDIRNTRVIDIIRELEDFGITVQTHDPLADAHEAKKEYGVLLLPFKKLKPAHALIFAVAHEAYRKLTPTELKKNSRSPGIIFDVKNMFDKNTLKRSGFKTWGL